MLSRRAATPFLRPDQLPTPDGSPQHSAPYPRAFEAPERIIAERHHTAYDQELGWVNIPNVDIPDMYGPDVFLTTNRLGFRGRREVDREVPPGKRRVIPSGHSVTFGYAVDDNHT